MTTHHRMLGSLRAVSARLNSPAVNAWMGFGQKLALAAGGVLAAMVVAGAPRVWTLAVAWLLLGYLAVTLVWVCATLPDDSVQLHALAAELRGCAGCRELGPLLTAPGTSGRVWRCECGTTWRPGTPGTGSGTRDG